LNKLSQIAARITPDEFSDYLSERVYKRCSESVAL